MTNSLFDLSLLICTRNRAAQLAKTLKRVSAIQSQLKWELVVVDNGSTDRTSAVVAEFAAGFHHPVQTLIQQGRGVAVAKNAGWRATRSGIIACIDDDCYPEEDHLDAIFEFFSKDPRLGFMGGRILLHDPMDRRITIQESLEPLFFRPGALSTRVLFKVQMSRIGGPLSAGWAASIPGLELEHSTAAMKWI